MYALDLSRPLAKCRELSATNTALAALIQGWESENMWQEDHMIKKVNGGYKVVSEKKGKNLGGPYKTR